MNEEMGAENQVPEKVRVWDVPVRLSHWAIVCLVLTSWISVDQGLMRLHLWSGIAMLALLLFRVVWGIFGSSTARFSTFVKSPQEVFAYLRALRKGRKMAYAGHNPAGGWMVVCLMSILVAQSTTGLFANDGVRFHGPLALEVGSHISDVVTSVHGRLFNVLLLLVYLHVVAVFFYLLVKREDLITPMFTGSKGRHLVPYQAELKFLENSIALCIYVVVTVTVWLLVGR